ncbi:MAG: CoA-binding protein [Candidatus Helarchaeota archaeon]
MIDLHSLFYPKSVALIGVSDLPIKGATPFLYALRRVQYPNPVYNVNKKRDRVMFDEPAYSSILDIPDEIDYAIVGVPAKEVPEIIQQCSQKGVKFVSIFSSGFSELGTEEGSALERAFLKNAKGLRIIGPNCLGVYCQESRVTISEILEIPEHRGDVAFISQSGGHTGAFFALGEHRGIHFHKVVSLGNQSDLTIQDFIEYFGNDEKISVISVYIERVKDTPRFLEILKDTSRKKPVIFWKGGITEEGLIAAASHTGAIHSSYAIFKSALQQNGGILTSSMEELADLTLGARLLSSHHLGNRIGILVPGGGSCVEMADEATQNGLRLPELSQNTRAKIQSQIQEVNTTTRNPVDLGVMGWFPRVFGKVIKYIAEDPQVDVVIFYFMTERCPSFIERMRDKRLGNAFIRNIRQAQRTTSKPLVAIVPNFIVTNVKITKIRKDFINSLIKIGIPHFSSMGRAANVILKLEKYQRNLTQSS